MSGKSKRRPAVAAPAAPPPVGGKVVIAYCHPGTVHAAFHESLLDLLVYDMSHARRVVDGGGRVGVQASANVAGPRNAIVKQFLAESDAEWLLMLDSDMTFQPDLVDRLIEHADPHTAPIVGGLCFGIDDGWLFPTLYDLAGTVEEPQFVRYNTWAPEQMMPVFATGAAALLMHRRALKTVQAGRFSAVYPWFQEREAGGMPVGEDVTFCWRAQSVGMPVHVNTAVHLGHVKQHTLTMDGYLTQRSLRTDEPKEAA
jgi:GT2 family glycosyltransferase